MIGNNRCNQDFFLTTAIFTLLSRQQQITLFSYDISMDTSWQYDDRNRKIFVELNFLNQLKFSLLRTNTTNEKKISTQKLKLWKSFEKNPLTKFPPFLFCNFINENTIGLQIRMTTTEQCPHSFFHLFEELNQSTVKKTSLSLNNLSFC